MLGSVSMRCMVVSRRRVARRLLFCTVAPLDAPLPEIYEDASLWADPGTGHPCAVQVIRREDDMCTVQRESRD